tara:strand:+ start:79 stop:465 length:387 start_codon:yes stop_codon:yes gene_type:complete
MVILTGGCTGDYLNNSKQLSLTTTPQIEDTSQTSSISSSLSSYYDDTVNFVTKDCGLKSYSVATGKALVSGLGGGLWGAAEGSFYGGLHGDSVEGVVIGSILGSGIGLGVGVKKAYDGFKSDTINCNS